MACSTTPYLRLVPARSKMRSGLCRCRLAQSTCVGIGITDVAIWWASRK